MNVWYIFSMMYLSEGEGLRLWGDDACFGGRLIECIFVFNYTCALIRCWSAPRLYWSSPCNQFQGSRTDCPRKIAAHHLCDKAQNFWSETPQEIFYFSKSAKKITFFEFFLFNSQGEERDSAQYWLWVMGVASTVQKVLGLWCRGGCVRQARSPFGVCKAKASANFFRVWEGLFRDRLVWLQGWGSTAVWQRWMKRHTDLRDPGRGQGFFPRLEAIGKQTLWIECNFLVFMVVICLATQCLTNPVRSFDWS